MLKSITDFPFDCRFGKSWLRTTVQELKEEHFPPSEDSEPETEPELEPEPETPSSPPAKSAAIGMEQKEQDEEIKEEDEDNAKDDKNVDEVYVHGNAHNADSNENFKTIQFDDDDVSNGNSEADENIEDDEIDEDLDQYQFQGTKDNEEDDAPMEEDPKDKDVEDGNNEDEYSDDENDDDEDQEKTDLDDDLTDDDDDDDKSEGADNEEIQDESKMNDDELILLHDVVTELENAAYVTKVQAEETNLSSRKLRTPNRKASKAVDWEHLSSTLFVGRTAQDLEDRWRSSDFAGWCAQNGRTVPQNSARFERALRSASSSSSSSSSVRSGRRDNCPGLHGLKMFKTPERVQCSNCGESFDDGTFLGCRACDYDICEGCCESVIELSSDESDEELNPEACEACKGKHRTHTCDIKLKRIGARNSSKKTPTKKSKKPRARSRNQQKPGRKGIPIVHTDVFGTKTPYPSFSAAAAALGISATTIRQATKNDSPVKDQHWFTLAKEEKTEGCHDKHQEEDGDQHDDNDDDYSESESSEDSEFAVSSEDEDDSFSVRTSLLSDQVPRRSKYTGLTWNKKAKKWQVRITVHGKRHYLGTFFDERKAALQYDKHAKQHGKKLNFEDKEDEMLQEQQGGQVASNNVEIMSDEDEDEDEDDTNTDEKKDEDEDEEEPTYNKMGKLLPLSHEIVDRPIAIINSEGDVTEVVSSAYSLCQRIPESVESIRMIAEGIKEIDPRYEFDLMYQDDFGKGRSNGGVGRPMKRRRTEETTAGQILADLEDSSSSSSSSTATTTSTDTGIGLKFKVNSRVEAIFQKNLSDGFYPGSLLKDNGDGTFIVDFDDGDRDNCVHFSHIRPHFLEECEKELWISAGRSLHDSDREIIHFDNDSATNSGC
jgi:hypothetical protein